MTTAEASLTGLVPLSRFTLRRDRVRIVIWIAAIVLLVAVDGRERQGPLPDQAELDKAAAASKDNVAAIIFNGPPQALDTVGGQVAFQMGTFGLMLMGLMSVFMLGRLTRGEEEAGRYRAACARSPIGAHALPAAAMITVAAMNVVVGALVALTLIGLDLPAMGSVVFGLSFTLFGLLLVALTLVAAQVTENTRVVYGIGGVVLGASFVLRAIGDIGDGTISWLSPIGWAQKTRPYAGERWWPFLIIVGVTGLLAWLALAVRTPPRPRLGPHRAPSRAARAPRLARHSARSRDAAAARQHRGWSAGLLVLGVAYGSIADSHQRIRQGQPGPHRHHRRTGGRHPGRAVPRDVVPHPGPGRCRLRDPVHVAHSERGNLHARRAGAGHAGFARRGSRRAISRSRSAARSWSCSSSGWHSAYPMPRSPATRTRFGCRSSARARMRLRCG